MRNQISWGVHTGTSLGPSPAHEDGLCVLEEVSMERAGRAEHGSGTRHAPASSILFYLYSISSNSIGDDV